MMVFPRAALTALGLGLALVGRVARAAEPPPAAPAAPAAPPAPPASATPPETPGARAVLAPEEPAVGGAVPELGDALDTALDGKPIRRVEVVVAGTRWLTRPVVTRVRAGEPLSAEAGRRASRELLESGAFARANVEAFAEGDGAVLRVHVLPRRLIAAIQITGAVLDRGDTLEAAAISDGGELTAPVLDQIGPRVRRYYDQHGFPSARVKIDTTDTDKPDRVVLSLEIEAGAPRTIARRVFVIDPSLDREVGDLKAKYRFGTGARVDEPRLAEADRELTELLRKSGFLRAEVRHSLRNTGATSELQVHLDPGPRFVPLFDGNRAFDAGELGQALNLQKAPDARSGELVDRLKSFYVNRGFYDVEVAAVEKGTPDEAVHYLAITVRENRQTRVVKRVFPCLPSHLNPDDLGAEIDSFLAEELPGNETFSAVDPRQIERIFGPTMGAGRRAVSADLNPLVTYAPDVYDRAIKHLRDLYRSKGYLNAVIGPVSLVRATCARRSPAGACLPEPTAIKLTAHCLKDSLGLPIPEPPASEAFACTPDPARNVECSPDLTVRLPIHLGPQTRVYDLAFEGNRTLTEEELGKIAAVPLGAPLSTLELEAARLRLVDAYRLRGWVYADVRSSVEPSPDRTRARVRFSLTEREKVTVSGFVIKGAARTDPGLILRRLVLKVGGDFRQDLVRQSEERVATLGTFSSVLVALEDADVPQRSKRVIVTVVEQPTQYFEPRLGFSTGEGGRFAFEYGHRNIAGLAVALTLRVQLGYLFDFLILDPAVRQNYGIDEPPEGVTIRPAVGVDRIERRDTISIVFPEIGLGPVVSFSIDGIDTRRNQRDFGLTKDALVPTLSYRPTRQILTQLSVSAERNEVQIFNRSAQTSSISTLIRAPEGTTAAFSQRVAFTWDRRDNAFNATRGTLFSTSAEHVNAFPALGDDTATVTSHFVRFTGRFAGYFKLPFGVTFAASVAAGVNVQLFTGSHTYPDRLFFLGGVDSIRAFLADSMVPEDIAQTLIRTGDLAAQDPSRCTTAAASTTGDKVTSICDVSIRGGDVMINPRLELRFPLTSTFQGGVFLDTGNLWTAASLIRPWDLRYGLGAGVRVATPIGPLAFDYGFNLTQRPWEDLGAFHFSIGLF